MHSSERKRASLHILFFLVALLFSMTLHAQTLVFEGWATDIEDGTPLYSERHIVEIDEGGQYLRSSVTYRDMDGNVLAEKTLDFEQALSAPALMFADRQNQVTYRSDLIDGLLKLQVQALDDDSKAYVSIETSPSKQTIVDAGFDQYLMMNWSPLISGERLSFDFLALSRSELVGFDLALVSKSEKTARFSISPSSWIVRLLMDPIYLDYDLASKRLLRYEGLTNIPNPETGDNYQAIIEYAYVVSDETDQAKVASTPSGNPVTGFERETIGQEQSL